jgi:hypothetical protein
MKVQLLAGLILASIALNGCGDSGSSREPAARVDVSGSVTLKGKPLTAPGIGLAFKNGIDTETVSIDADGNFRGQAPVGSCKVMVIVVSTPDGGHVELSKTGVPANYQTVETPLTADVKAADNTPFEFDIVE